MGKIDTFRCYDDNKLYYKCILLFTVTGMGQHNTHNLHITKKTRKITESIKYILDALPTDYTQQAFTHASGIFHHMSSMQVSTLHDEDDERE